MTLDDLVKIGDDAYVATRPYVNGLHNGNRARTKAIVAALRDHLIIEMQKVHSLPFQFNEILASDGGEAAGDVNPDGCADVPAASGSPAADVCEWTTLALDPMGYGWMRAACNGFESHERGLINQTPPYKCPSCGKPIAFKEPQR